MDPLKTTNYGSFRWQQGQTEDGFLRPVITTNLHKENSVNYRPLKKMNERSDYVNKEYVWRHFAETTSCHGVREILHSKHIFWKIFWSISVLLHFSLLIFGCYCVTSDYLNAPTVTKVSIQQPHNMTLPSVAICNTNGLNRTAMAEDGIPTKVQWDLRSLSRMQFMPEILKAANKKGLDVSYFLKRYTYTCDELLYGGNCSIGTTSNKVTQRCCEKARPIFHLDFGICYVISGENQTRAGVKNGYKFDFTIPPKPEISKEEDDHAKTLDYNPTTFLDGLAIEIGYRSNPLLMSKNQMVSVSLRPEKHSRDAEDGQCHKDTDEPKFVSNIACFEWCRAKAYRDYCGCGMFADSEGFFPDSRLCTSMGCLKENDTAIKNQTDLCRLQCKPLCDTWNYKPSVTYGDLSAKPEGINLRLQMGYSHLEYTWVQEVKSFTVFMAISSLGGQAGLWMGCSILTVIHFITYCCWAFTLGCTNQIKTVAKRDSVASFLDTSYTYIRRKTRFDLPFGNQEEVRV